MLFISLVSIILLYTPLLTLLIIIDCGHSPQFQFCPSFSFRSDLSLHSSSRPLPPPPIFIASIPIHPQPNEGARLSRHRSSYTLQCVALPVMSLLLAGCFSSCAPSLVLGPVTAAAGFTFQRCLSSHTGRASSQRLGALTDLMYPP